VRVAHVPSTLWLLDLVFPRCCVGCGASGSLCCDSCFRGIQRLGPPWCDRCGAPTAWPVARCRECDGRRIAFTDARAAIAYDGTTRALVRAWKERGLRRLGELATDLVVERLDAPRVDVVTWVPAVHDRFLERGHSTAEQLAGGLAGRWSLDPEPLLGRTRYVGAQRGRDRSARRSNVRGAFRAARRVPPRVCLVDDVYTTGATVSAAATALRAAGARQVHVITLARTMRALDSG
jgi:ComF family protein